MVSWLAFPVGHWVCIVQSLLGIQPGSAPLHQHHPGCMSDSDKIPASVAVSYLFVVGFLITIEKVWIPLDTVRLSRQSSYQPGIRQLLPVAQRRHQPSGLVNNNIITKIMSERQR